ncbi:MULTISPECIES: acyl carrier protein [unclassified Psychrobacter]|uniref:acyl carrier protein n=1 Tax=unclassified Psychrobacter TaxID=196806 RepID=UPI00097F3A15|nr:MULTISPECIES: acyl carrier protein [unclassified Psychrobacter]MBA6244922.1 acyl carrier protein [Psychrobacter sp. Urea-trap-18]MBA6286467.1 acyl carrier protein [Psychrobacter sp. Urea-trap-16]MBA6318478.1 acyl carrier protein [Psychrobacter sp. Urea-trap-20]MBA6334699.1 acyl carrier protein [Psychrobacter sp. Urea-trap-19]PKG61339.1 acyl carrier protein [Psychrobacter sp. Choline-3u-12]|tara:strand:- start:1869 stop:2117 length:249 start_codon:yes stop_codon:yes gene_type:complete
MTHEKIMKLVANTIEETFMVDATEVTRDTVAIDISGWDSLSHTILLSNIEDQLDQTLDLEELDFKNVGDLVDFIIKQVNSSL